MAYRIYLSPPYMGGQELSFVQEAFDTNWISPAGPAITSFEEEMAAFTGVRSALALSSGTAGIHLCLRWLGVGQGDRVFCSDFTFIGSCDAILYEKAIPVFIDSEPNTWNMSPVALSRALAQAKTEDALPKAIIIVDLYGESADWDALLPICQAYGVPVIEDAAEALGAFYKGKPCGSFGDLSVLSFNGNKIMTTSGGGMVLSDNTTAIDKMRFWSTQAREPALHYEHKEVGYNYRMSNVCASIGRGQLLCMPEKLAARRRIHSAYTKAFTGLPLRVKQAAKGVDSSNYWLSMLEIDEGQINQSEIVLALAEAGIESRPAWKPMHMQPVFEGCAYFAHNEGTNVGADVFARALCLPSGDAMGDQEIGEVVEVVRNKILT